MPKSEIQSQRTAILVRSIPGTSTIDGDGIPTVPAADENGVLFSSLGGDNAGGGGGFASVFTANLYTGALVPENINLSERFLGVTNFPLELDGNLGRFNAAESFAVIDAIDPNTADLEKFSQISFGYAFSGTGDEFDRLRTMTAVNAGLTNVEGVQLTTGPAQWTETDAPAAATAASATRAAGGAGTRLIIQSISCSAAAGAAALGITEFRLRDGAAGTILWRGKVNAVINSHAALTPSNLNIVLTANTAAVLESDAGAAGSEIAVSMSGIQVN